MLTSDQIDNLLREYGQALLKAPRQKVHLTREWVNGFPESPAVYALFVGKQLIYVGETGCLRKRMGDMLRSTNHNFRRQIGKHLFSERKGFVGATSHQKFAPDLEVELCDWITSNAKVSSLQIDFGRKEIEEYLVDSIKPKCNSKSRRK